MCFFPHALFQNLPLSLLVRICSDFLIPYFFSHGHFCLLAWLVNYVLLFLTADLGSFLVFLYHLWMPFTGATSAFGFGLSMTTLNHLVLAKTRNIHKKKI